MNGILAQKATKHSINSSLIMCGGLMTIKRKRDFCLQRAYLLATFNFLDSICPTHAAEQCSVAVHDFLRVSAICEGHTRDEKEKRAADKLIESDRGDVFIGHQHAGHVSLHSTYGRAHQQYKYKRDVFLLRDSALACQFQNLTFPFWEMSF